MTDCFVHDVHADRAGPARAEASLQVPGVRLRERRVEIGQHDVATLRDEVRRDGEPEALGGTGDERHLPRHAAPTGGPGRDGTPIRLRLPCLDERSLGVGEGPHATQGQGAFGDAQRVEVDVARRVRLAPRVTGGEQPEARHDHDDGQRAVGGQVRAQAFVEQPRQVLRRDVNGHVHQERPGSRVDDLVGGERSAQHEGPSGGRGGERGSEGRVIERHDPERVAARQQPAEQRRDHLDQHTRASRLDAGRAGISGEGSSGHRRGATLGAPDPLEEPRGALVDLLGRVSADDEPVVLHQGHRRRRPAGAGLVDAASIDDGAREREPGIGVGHPQRLVAEQAPGERCAVAVAGDGIDLDRVGVQDEALGQEGVEEQLHGGPAPAGVTQPRGHPGAHDRVPHGSVRVGRRVAGAEHLEERVHVQRDEVVHAERGEGDAARLDVKDAVDLCRGVAAPASRELGVATIAPGNLDEGVQRRDRPRRQLASSRLEGAHRAATLDAASISSAPISANQRTRDAPSGKPGLSRPSPST